MLTDELDTPSESETSTGSWATIYVSDVEAMSEELNSRRSNSVKIKLYPPNDIAQIHVTDPWKICWCLSNHQINNLR